MPKPNRYMGNGKVYPNGTRMGRYVMRNGHWVDHDSPLGRATPTASDYKNTMRLAVWSGAIVALVIALALMFAVTR